RAVDQINVEPPVVVVIEESHAARRRFEDVAFVGHARDVAELLQSRAGGHVGEVNGRAVHEASGGDRARAGVFDGFEGPGRARAALRLPFLCLGKRICLGATEAHSQGEEDKETGRQGDKETARRGNAVTRRFEFSFPLSPPLLVSSSPCLPLSSYLCVSVSL